MDKETYLKMLVGEIMADPEWQVPDQVKGMLMFDLEWGMLDL